ncbi:hypothetical protein SAMN02745121_07614 [Nannocystis exedens]|uniref:Antibiotic biosynthesis monooxygenase n=1 Tax=Nannocystis exedens TaxID=54 RepID=A0A1I2GZT0_9BACT|nr:hypothetical protein [Nannocystis exedens]PCC68857.1 hypothetical protein NAEX_01877 [Nannocystis exedens]SFF22653.1 hypothetical protein SAMN02745121_07614 [Nannocystis exedens]
MVRYTVPPEHAPQVDAAIEQLFAAVRRQQPAGIRYWYGRLADGATYVALLELDEGVDNPLLALPEARQFQAELRRYVAAPPPEPVTVLGSYRSA